MAQSFESWRTETTLLTTVMQCFKEAVTDNHFLANLLHPNTYKGKQLSEAEEAAWQLLLKLLPEHPEVIADLCAFTAGSDPFPASLLSSACIECRLFRGGHLCQTAKCKVSPPLISTALKLLHLPSSSTATSFWCKANYEISLAWKRQQNLWHATDSCMEMLNWTGLETEMDIGMDQDRLWNI